MLTDSSLVGGFGRLVPSVPAVLRGWGVCWWGYLQAAELQGSSGQAELLARQCFPCAVNASCKLQTLSFSAAMAVLSVKPKLIGQSCWLCALCRVENKNVPRAVLCKLFVTRELSFLH